MRLTSTARNREPPRGSTIDRAGNKLVSEAGTGVVRQLWGAVRNIAGAIRHFPSPRFRHLPPPRPGWKQAGFRGRQRRGPATVGRCSKHCRCEPSDISRPLHLSGFDIFRPLDLWVSDIFSPLGWSGNSRALCETSKARKCEAVPRRARI